MLEKIIDISLDNILNVIKFIIVKNDKRHYFYCDSNYHHYFMYNLLMNFMNDDTLKPRGGGVVLAYKQKEQKYLMLYGMSHSLGKFPKEITAELLSEYINKDEKKRLGDYIIDVDGIIIKS